MPTFCRKPQVASFYSSLIQPYTKMCHRTTDRTTDRYTDEIIHVRFHRYVSISFTNFLLRKKYIAQLNKIVYIISRTFFYLFKLSCSRREVPRKMFCETKR